MRKAKRIAQTVCITVPPDLLKKAQKIAAQEHRTMSELFREALRHYIAEGARGGALASQPTKQSEIEVGQGDQRESGVVHSFRMERPTEK